METLISITIIGVIAIILGVGVACLHSIDRRDRDDSF